MPMSIDSQPSAPSIDPNRLASAILGAAGWARVGITMPDEHLREMAARELALTIIDEIDPRPQPDPRQLALFR